MRLALFLALLPLLPSAAADDFRLTLTPGSPPSFEATGVTWTTEDVDDGRKVVGNLTTPKTRLVGVIESKGYFDVGRARQIVPEADEHFFLRVSGDVADSEGEARLVNESRTGNDITLRVSFPVNGRARLSLTRDVEPPGFEVGAVQDLAWNRFLLTTQTREYALGNLEIWPEGDSQRVPFPTQILSLQQTFPVQGLRENTTYRYEIHFEDWAGNSAKSEEYTIATPARPRVAGPRLLNHRPADGARLTQAPEEISAVFEATSGAISPAEHVRLFVDLKEVSHLAERTPTFISYVPSPVLGRGTHRVGLELSDSAGGFTLATWTFTVGNEAPGPGLVAFLAALALVLVRRRT